MTYPNMPLPTMGGKIFWETLENNNGWKLQKHLITSHYRILDPHDFRRDWDTNYERIKHTYEIFLV